MVRGFRSAIEPVVYWLFFVSLAALLLKLLILDSVPAPFPLLHTLGGLCETVLRSLLGGTVFYVTVTATKTYGDRKRLMPWLVDRIETIVARHQELTSFLVASAGEEASGDPAMALSHLRSIDLTPEFIDLDGNRSTWREYLRKYAVGIADYCAQISRRSAFVEPDIIKCLTDIEHSHFIIMQSSLPDQINMPFKLDVFHPVFLEYQHSMEQLVKHRDRLMRDYGVSLPDYGEFPTLELAPADTEEPATADE